MRAVCNVIRQQVLRYESTRSVLSARRCARSQASLLPFSRHGGSTSSHAVAANRRAWQRDEIQKAQHLKSQEITLKEIAKVLERPFGSVKGLLYNNQEATPRQNQTPWTQEEIDLPVKRLGEKAPRKTIAAETQAFVPQHSLCNRKTCGQAAPTSIPACSKKALDSA